MDSCYDNFLYALRERYPVKTDLVNALTDLLRIEKESIYRRLRKDVSFTVEETMRISRAWNISLDNIAGAHPRKTVPFRLKMVQFVDPTEDDYAIIEQHNRDLELVAADPDGMAIEIVNALPRGLYARSEPLTRFFTMKWRHKFAPERALAFGEITVPQRLRKLDLEYIDIEHRFPQMHSIHDPRMIENLVHEIDFYRSIGMLTREDTLLLGDELLRLVDYIEQVALTGYFPGAGNRLYFYLSHTWIETEYLLFRSAGFNMSMTKVLERNAIVSLDRSVLDRFMKMALATKRMSVLISESNARGQAEFFNRQRQIVSALAAN